MLRVRLALIVLIMSTSASAAPAAAGLSDLAATRACWIRAPYALVKCESEGGRYPAEVVRARPRSPEEDSSWSFSPVGYDGIVPLETVVDDVEQVAFAGRFLLAKQRSSRVVIVDLDNPEGRPIEFASVEAANEILAGHGVPKVSEADFRSFASVYQEFRQPRSGWVLPLLACVAATVCGAALMWLRRRIRGSYDNSP